MKLPIRLLEKSASEFQKNKAEIADIQARIAKTPAITLDGQAHYELRRAMIAATAREPFDLAFERYVGANDLLAINYLSIGNLQARSVGRIRYFDKRIQKTAYATGFMVSPDLMMTNHHVFPVVDSASFAQLTDDATLEFNYELDVNGKLAPSVVHAIEPTRFFHASEELDFALVAIHLLDNTGQHQVSEQGYLVLNGNLGKAGTGDFATIIQHPDGQQKQIALRNNEIVDNTLDNVVIYKSDTAQGSSGAPVFNNEWQLIALHSAGVAKKDAQGNYLDKDNQTIPIVEGGVDEARVVWLANRGVRVSAIMKHLASTRDIASHPLVQVFNSPAYTDGRHFVALSNPQPAEKEQLRTTPGLSATALTQPLEIRISISNGAIAADPVPASVVATLLAPAPEFEKKLEDEQEYTACDGYDSEFMGVSIPLPVPSPALRKKLAFLSNNPSAFTLKYYHFSTIQHAVRRVPVVSAINVNGKFRYDALGDDSRKDHWLRDNRIDYDAQLDDKWYAKSGFDKGHLSRREDAEWGTTMAKAKAAADLTCSYANAAPQVPALNRAIYGYHGRWGQLEQDLLEKSIKLENGKSSRVSIFAGPLFLDDDPVYASVQVALSFFKIVAWYNGEGALQATGFRLSQEKLVGAIEWEELHIDELLKTDQKSIDWIEKATGLKFPKVLKDADTNK